MLAYSCLCGPPRLLVLLRWPYWPLSRLCSSLRLRVGLRLPPPTRLCLLRTCATPAWLRSPPHFRPIPDGPPLAFSPNYRTLSNYLLFCLSLRFRLTLLSIVGPPLALPMVVGQPRALTLFLRPQLALLLLRIHPLAFRFLLQLRSLVWCRSLRGPLPVALRSLNVWQSDLLPFLIVFPLGFRLIDAGMYVRAAALHRRPPPLLAVLPCEGGRCAVPVATASAFYVLYGEGCGLLLGVTTLALYVSFG